MISRPIGNHWAGGSGQNWTTGFALSITQDLTFTSSQDARIQDAPEALVQFSSPEQVQEQMTCPKEAKGNSEDSGYSTAPEAMVKFGQMSPPSPALAISLFPDSKTQDAPEATVKLSSLEQVQEQMTCTKEAKGISQDSDPRLWYSELEQVPCCDGYITYQRARGCRCWKPSALMVQC
jgi:hypothetical protein